MISLHCYCYYYVFSSDREVSRLDSQLFRRIVDQIEQEKPKKGNRVFKKKHFFCIRFLILVHYNFFIRKEKNSVSLFSFFHSFFPFSLSFFLFLPLSLSPSFQSLLSFSLYFLLSSFSLSLFSLPCSLWLPFGIRRGDGRLAVESTAVARLDLHRLPNPKKGNSIIHNYQIWEF